MAEIAIGIKRQMFSQIFSRKHSFHHMCTQCSVLFEAGLCRMCLWWRHVHVPYCTRYRRQLLAGKMRVSPLCGAGVLHQQSCDLTDCLASVNSTALSGQMSAPAVHHAWCWGVLAAAASWEERKTSVMKGLGRETVDF